ncbi:MAG: type II toxin-antitoxin system PemK/MazF family toxin [Candidatus Coatesbacteria bacterium]|nr:type II toxin-antitoxin system PemK/MazF family toxin [Candidatus Coatesbacteria bacterium]
MSNLQLINRGSVWLINLSSVGAGHEQQGKRPAVVLSADIFNNGPAGLLIIAPITTSDKGYPLHHPIQPPEGGLVAASYIMVDQLRTISKQRLIHILGNVSSVTLEKVEGLVRILLDM